jgi:predicted porin
VLPISFAAGANARQDGTAEGAEKSSAVPEREGQRTEAGEEGGEDESGPSDAQQRELGAEEDPMAVSDAQREEKRVEEEKGEQVPATGFDIYGSLRVRYREQGAETVWQDSSSRLGAEIDWNFWKNSYLFARYEAGFNVLTGLNPDKSFEEFRDTVFTRLQHVGLDTPATNLVAGKNWSAYYEVAAFTDRFVGAGGSASGAFNAQTDGGPTGPGRADRTLQTKLSLDFLPHRVFKPFDLNVQVQHGNPVPFGNGAEYGTAVGVSAVMTTRKDFTVGIAYNHADVDLDRYPALRDVGLRGPARALLVGTRAFGDRWYAGLVLARLENHETTDDGIYFDGWGSEFYGQYRLFDRLWLVGGYNILEPDADQVRARDYRVRYAAAGLRYTFDDFRRMIFANVRFDDGMSAAGTLRTNVYTIGVRWDLSTRGWHVFN